jgi:hypothetical protein
MCRAIRKWNDLLLATHGRKHLCAGRLGLDGEVTVRSPAAV